MKEGFLCAVSFQNALLGPWAGRGLWDLSQKMLRVSSLSTNWPHPFLVLTQRPTFPLELFVSPALAGDSLLQPTWFFSARLFHYLCRGLLVTSVSIQWMSAYSYDAGVAHKGMRSSRKEDKLQVTWWLDIERHWTRTRTRKWTHQDSGTTVPMYATNCTFFVKAINK